MKKETYLKVIGSLIGLSIWQVYDRHRSNKSWLQLCKTKDELLEKQSDMIQETIVNYDEVCMELAKTRNEVLETKRKYKELLEKVTN